MSALQRMYRRPVASRFLRRLGLAPFARLDPTLEAAKGHRSFDAMSGILAWMLGYLQDAFGPVSLEGRAALEIGSGKFLAHAMGLYACGCRTVVSVDKFRQVDPAAVSGALARPILAPRFLSRLTDVDSCMARIERLAETGGEPERLGALGITYRAPFDLTASDEYDRMFDLCLSYTVLEHIPPADLPAVIAKSVTVLRPGGLCIHFVDLQDHRDARHVPFAFLAPQPAWGEEDCFARGNRMRMSEWRALFEAHPEVEWRFPHVATRTSAPLPDEIDAAVAHRDRDDLMTAGFLVAGRRS